MPLDIPMCKEDQAHSLETFDNPLAEVEEGEEAANDPTDDHVEKGLDTVISTVFKMVNMVTGIWRST